MHHSHTAAVRPADLRPHVQTTASSSQRRTSTEPARVSPSKMVEEDEESGTQEPYVGQQDSATGAISTALPLSDLVKVELHRGKHVHIRRDHHNAISQ